MTTLVAIAITTGILSGIWGWLSVSLGLLTWAGFLGCTSYFASPVDGHAGLRTSMITNITGVCWALVIIHGSQWVGSDILGYVITGIVSCMMCLQAKQKLLAYIPGTFIGCCATFAANGDWQVVVPSLLIGGSFAYLMKKSGLMLQAKLNQPSTPVKSGHPG